MRASYLTELKKNKRLLCCEKVTLTYNGNTNTSGTAPIDGFSPYNSGSLVNVLGNLGNLEKTNYAFSAWNTAANGSGTTYLPNDIFIINKNTILYAMWIPVYEYRLYYDGNGNTDGHPPEDTNVYNGLTPATIRGKNTLEKDGYTFIRWNTQANNLGIPLYPTDTYYINQTTTLYAIWEPIFL
jgi:uncharacterized repeat protein (TIGR02543 family)